MITKIRPKTTLEVLQGNAEGYAIRIAYFCPNCGRSITEYKEATACDQCGTFYDWGNKAPNIVMYPIIEWEDNNEKPGET